MHLAGRVHPGQETIAALQQGPTADISGNLLVSKNLDPAVKTIDELPSFKKVKVETSDSGPALKRRKTLAKEHAFVDTDAPSRAEL